MKNIYVLVFLVSFSPVGISQNLDIELLRDIHMERNERLDPPFTFITNSVSPLSIAVPLGAVTYALIQKDQESRDDAVIITSSVVLSGAISLGLKYAVDRDRPFETYGDIENVSPSHTPSFPSGHSTHAFSLATSLSLAYPRWYVIVPSYVWAGAVGYSRMHLGYHYPSDVLAGVLIGSGSSYLCYKINQKIKERNENMRLTSSWDPIGFGQLTLIIPLD